MLARIGIVALTIVCGISLGKELVSNQSDTRYISIRYVDEGEKTKVLAKHTLQLGKDGTIDFTAGGETIPHDAESALHFGTRITGKLVSIENDSYRASITLKLGNLIECDDAATARSIRMLGTANTTRTGKRIKTTLWCESMA